MSKSNARNVLEAALKAVLGVADTAWWAKAPATFVAELADRFDDSSDEHKSALAAATPTELQQVIIQVSRTAHYAGTTAAVTVRFERTVESMWTAIRATDGGLKSQFTRFLESFAVATQEIAAGINSILATTSRTEDRVERLIDLASDTTSATDRIEKSLGAVLAQLGQDTKTVEQRDIETTALGTPAQSIDVTLEPTGADEPTGTGEHVMELLSLIWQFPMRGDVQRSWAVKESSILRDRLRDAEESPGLGIALFSTEFAAQAWGKASEDRIGGCIEWAIGQTEHTPPYRVQVEHEDRETSQITLRPDLRHTISLGIILARAEQCSHHVEHYLRLVLDTQEPNGGWPAGEGVTVTKVFSVIYAVEFLELCSTLGDLTGLEHAEAAKTRDRGIAWLIGDTAHKSGWESGVFEGLSWDTVFTTAWVIRRLAPLARPDNTRWIGCLTKSLSWMVAAAQRASTWVGADDPQPFRVEARVASAASIGLRRLPLAPVEKERIAAYCRHWRRRASSTLDELPLNQWDLATSLFLIDSLADPVEIQRLAARIREDS